MLRLLHNDLSQRQPGEILTRLCIDDFDVIPGSDHSRDFVQVDVPAGGSVVESAVSVLFDHHGSRSHRQASLAAPQHYIDTELLKFYIFLVLQCSMEAFYGKRSSELPSFLFADPYDRLGPTGG